jgi:hypothetical protein
MIRKVEQYLDDYKRRTGSFPPDGIDSQVTNEEGTPIQGSACLYYFLSKKPIPLVEIRAGKKIITELPPIGTFLESELGPASSEYPRSAGADRRLAEPDSLRQHAGRRVPAAARTRPPSRRSTTRNTPRTLATAPTTWGRTTPCRRWESKATRTIFGPTASRVMK